jgi:hypothetical protein
MFIDAQRVRFRAPVVSETTPFVTEPPESTGRTAEGERAAP